jgi:hypothetical protein
MTCWPLLLPPPAVSTSPSRSRRSSSSIVAKSPSRRSSPSSCRRISAAFNKCDIASVALILSHALSPHIFRLLPPQGYGVHSIVPIPAPWQRNHGHRIRLTVSFAVRYTGQRPYCLTSCRRRVLILVRCLEFVACLACNIAFVAWVACDITFDASITCDIAFVTSIACMRACNKNLKRYDCLTV